MDQPIRILQCVTIMNRNGLENRLSELSGRVGMREMHDWPDNGTYLCFWQKSVFPHLLHFL